jgi:pimeloyl-ACP methyl ester carboxylesterase
MKPRALVFLLLGIAFLGSSCGTQHKSLLAPTEGGLTAQSAEGAGIETDNRGRQGAAQVTGQLGGSLFALYRPENWNGDLVLLAHGLVVPGSPIALPSADYTEPVRDSLLARHFGVAYSSFSENGYAVKDGAERTEQLALIYTIKLGRPHRIFLMGVSLGGQIAQMLAERHPRLYSGVLSLSGVLGGTRRELDYVGTVRVLFDYFYPGVLKGDLLHLPPDLNVDRDVIGPAVAAMSAHFEGAFALSQLAPVPFANGQELVESIVQALVLHAVELNDILARTDGQSFFDNANVVYNGPLPPPLLDDLNAHVARYHMGPAAAAFMRRYYEPTGRLTIPMLTLHTSRDPVVPLFHEDVYRELVEAAGNEAWLQQRVDDRYGHVGFPPEETMAAFADLVRWADTNVKPPWWGGGHIAASLHDPTVVEGEVARTRLGQYPRLFIR